MITRERKLSAFLINVYIMKPSGSATMSIIYQENIRAEQITLFFLKLQNMPKIMVLT